MLGVGGGIGGKLVSSGGGPFSASGGNVDKDIFEKCFKEKTV